MIYGLLGELEIAPDGQPLNLPAGITLIVLGPRLARANHPGRYSEDQRITLALGVPAVPGVSAVPSATGVQEVISRD